MYLDIALLIPYTVKNIQTIRYMDMFYNPQHAYRSSINIRPPCVDKNKHNKNTKPPYTG